MPRLERSSSKKPAEIRGIRVAGTMTLFQVVPWSHSFQKCPRLPKGVDIRLDVLLAAGHRYTVTMMGQMEDESLEPLVIDETAELEKVSATQGSHMVINNVAGTRTLDFDAYGSGPHDVPYGGFGIKVVGAGFAITVNDDPNAFIEGPFPDGPSSEPGTDFLSGFMGRYPGKMGEGIDVGESPPTSELDLVTFLQDSPDFDTFVSAVETAGLTELLSSGGPYLLLAPTNEAFEALPKDQLGALMADPEALAELLRNHIIEEYVPRGSLAETPGGPFNRTFTNLLGTMIEIGDGFTINGTYEGDTDSVFVANGTQVHPIMNVVLPPK